MLEDKIKINLRLFYWNLLNHLYKHDHSIKRERSLVRPPIRIKLASGEGEVGWVSQRLINENYFEQTAQIEVKHEIQQQRIFLPPLDLKSFLVCSLVAADPNHTPHRPSAPSCYWTTAQQWSVSSFNPRLPACFPPNSLSRGEPPPLAGGPRLRLGLPPHQAAERGPACRAAGSQAQQVGRRACPGRRTGFSLVGS